MSNYGSAIELTQCDTLFYQQLLTREIKTKIKPLMWMVK